MQSDDMGAAIAAFGQAMGPDVVAAVYRLYADEQAGFAASQPVTSADIAYGSHPRQTLDIYTPADVSGAPVLVWVHGGGFLRGEKSSPDHPFNAHVGRWAARCGFVGVVMNYRLAPEATWPAGGEDVGAVLDWARGNIAAFGGDPARIALIGTSAGSVHVATALMRGARPSAAVLLSGLYGLTPTDERDQLYYGDPALYAERQPLAALVESEVPLFLASAQHDPARFQTETLGLIAAIAGRRGMMPRAHIAGGHNHYSLATHIGGPDTRLTDEVLVFLDQSWRI
jgi:arylformamidase